MKTGRKHQFVMWDCKLGHLEMSKYRKCLKSLMATNLFLGTRQRRTVKALNQCFSTFVFYHTTLYGKNTLIFLYCTIPKRCYVTSFFFSINSHLTTKEDETTHLFLCCSFGFLSCSHPSFKDKRCAWIWFPRLHWQLHVILQKSVRIESLGGKGEQEAGRW